MTVEHTCITTYLSGQSPCSLQSLKYNIAGAINESSVVVDPPMRSSMALKLGIVKKWVIFIHVKLWVA